MEKVIVRGLARGSRDCRKVLVFCRPSFAELLGHVVRFRPLLHPPLWTEMWHWLQREHPEVGLLAQFSAGRRMPSWACMQRVASRTPGKDDRFRSAVYSPRVLSAMLGRVAKSPAAARLCGDRLALGSTGGLPGERHRAVASCPRDVTAPPAQRRVVSSDL